MTDNVVPFQKPEPRDLPPPAPERLHPPKPQIPTQRQMRVLTGVVLYDRTGFILASEFVTVNC